MKEDIFDMTFFNPTKDGRYIPLDKKRLEKAIRETKRRITYTYGLGYRNPVTNRKPVSKERALEIVRTEGWLDARATADEIHLNAYSENDMF